MNDNELEMLMPVYHVFRRRVELTRDESDERAFYHKLQEILVWTPSSIEFHCRQKAERSDSN